MPSFQPLLFGIVGERKKIKIKSFFTHITIKSNKLQNFKTVHEKEINNCTRIYIKKGMSFKLFFFFFYDELF
jgi:hypothetical protein